MNSEGERELLGTAIGRSKAEHFSSDFLRLRTHRGLRRVRL
jgi:transposase-like protein